MFLYSVLFWPDCSHCVADFSCNYILRRTIRFAYKSPIVHNLNLKFKRTFASISSVPLWVFKILKVFLCLPGGTPRIVCVLYLCLYLCICEFVFVCLCVRSLVVSSQVVVPAAPAPRIGSLGCGRLWSRVVPLVGVVAYEFQCPPCQPPNLILTTSEETDTNVDAT